MALVCNRADGTISALKIDGTTVTQTSTVPISPGVAHVESTPDGKHALAVSSPDNSVAILDVDGDRLSYNKLDIPTDLFPYNIVVTPDSKLAITADNGPGGSSDGSLDTATVIDPAFPHPHAIAHITVGDAPEGLAMSPKGDLAAVLNVNGSNFKGAWLYHPTGVVTILHIQGKAVTPIKTVEVGAFPEPLAFTPDGRYLYVGNYADEDFSILKVDGTEVTDIGKRFEVPGHPASMRMGPQSFASSEGMGSLPRPNLGDFKGCSTVLARAMIRAANGMQPIFQTPPARSSTAETSGFARVRHRVLQEQPIWSMVFVQPRSACTAQVTHPFSASRRRWKLVRKAPSSQFHQIQEPTYHRSGISAPRR